MVYKTLVPEENNRLCIDLDELINGIEDVTDPSSMDKVLGYVERIQMIDDNFMDLLTKTVHPAKVYWMRPWYQERGSIVRQDAMVVENDGTETYRTDAISQDEHELIVKNWDKFKKKYKLPDQIISLARWKNKTKSKNPACSAVEKARRFAAAYLSRGLKRTNAQVFRHIATHIGGYRKGNYTKTEEKIIEICYNHQPHYMASILSLILGRQPRGVYRRLEYLTHGKPEKKKQKWTLPLASKLVQLMLKYTQLEFEDLKNRHIQIWHWRRIEKDMGRSSCYLQYFWNAFLHTQLFVRCDVKLHKLRKTLFKTLRSKVRDSSYKVWSDIRWKDVIVGLPDGFTKTFAYRVCIVYLRNSLKEFNIMPLEDVVNYALQKLKRQNGKYRHKRLKTLRFNEEGELEKVNYQS